MPNELSNDPHKLAEEVNELAKVLGELAWKIGRKQLGAAATATQIANHIQKDFGGSHMFTPGMILNFMARVSPNGLFHYRQ